MYENKESLLLLVLEREKRETVRVRERHRQRQRYEECMKTKRETDELTDRHDITQIQNIKQPG